MGFYYLSIFNRRGTCIYFFENKETQRDKELVAEEQHLLYGMLFSMKLFCQKMAPPGTEGTETRLQCFRTGTYALHVFETATGLKFVLVTDENAKDLSGQMQEYHRDVYVECAAKNPFVLTGEDSIASSDLDTATERFITQKVLPFCSK